MGICATQGFQRTIPNAHVPVEMAVHISEYESNHQLEL